MFTTTAHLGDGPDLAGAEWGPAKHDPEHPLRRTDAGSFFGTALRDGDELRPDDN